jgi:HJR/Mrr/RecB family endonuclease
MDNQNVFSNKIITSFIKKGFSEKLSKLLNLCYLNNKDYIGKFNLEKYNTDLSYVEDELKEILKFRNNLNLYSFLLFIAIIVIIYNFFGTYLFENSGAIFLMSIPLLLFMCFFIIQGQMKKYFLNNLNILQNSNQFQNLLSLFSKEVNLIKKDVQNWQKLSWQEFELAVTNRLIELGYSAENTTFSNDQGVDSTFKFKDTEVLVQCKKYKKKIGTPTIRNLIGSMLIKKSKLGIVINSGSGYSKHAISLAKENNIILYNLEDFLMINEKNFRLELLKSIN